MFKQFYVYFQILLTFSFVTHGFAGITGKLEGVITDKETGDALPGANIILTETRQGAAAGVDGFFQIHNVHAGEYQVQIRMMGYRTLTFTHIVIRPDLKTKLNVAMEESPIEMDAVEIRAERPLIQTDVTGTTFDIDAEEIVIKPIDKFQDALGLQAGTTLEGNVRGGKTREVIYLIDGLPAQDWIQGGSGIDLPKTAISQMSMQTGGVNAEYGNALSGVVNVITASGRNKREMRLRSDKDDLFGGTQVSHKTDFELALSGPLKKQKLFYFTANRLNLTDTRWWQDFQHFYESPVRREFSGLSKIDLQINPAKRLSLQAVYARNDWKDYEFSWRFNLDGLPLRLRESIRPALIWTHTLSKNTFYSVTLSHYYLHSKIGEGGADHLDPRPYQYDFFLQYVIDGNRVWWADMKQHMSTLQTQLTSQIHAYHLLKTGFQLNRFDIESQIRKMEPQLTYFGKPLIFEPMLNYSTDYHYLPYSGSLYIQDKIEAGRDRSVINVGMRFDFLHPKASRPAVELLPIDQDEYQESVSGWIPAKIQTHFSPRIGFSFPLTDKSFFFINYGHYVQYPLFEYLYSGLDNVRLRNGVNVMRGNPELLAERTRAWELSARSILYENMVGSITYFQKETFDQIDTKTFVPSNSRIAGDYGFAGFVNNPYANASGFEFVLDREKGSWLTGTLSYTYMHAKGLSETVDQGINYEQWGFPVARHPFYLSWDQRHTFKADLTLQFPYGIRSDIVFQARSGRPYTYFPSKDGFTPENPSDNFMPNNKRMPGARFLNMRINKVFYLKNRFLFFSKLTVYFDGRNLFDNRNVLWIDSSGRIGGELGDPAAYSPRRRMSVGLQIDI